VLKERLRKHQAWLREHQVSDEQLQRMIDILSTHDDYEKELVRLLERPENSNRTPNRTPNRPWNLRSVGGAVGSWLWVGRSQSISNNANRTEVRYKDLKLPRLDDAAFLTELCVLRDDRPAYAQIAEEIIREATESLGAKLKRVSKDIAPRAERGVGSLLEDISSSFTERRLSAERVSKLELRDLIRNALDEEPGHPTDLYGLLQFALTSIALTPCRTRVVIRKVTVDHGYTSEQTQLPPLVPTKYDLPHPATMYRIDGDRVEPLHAGIRYKFNLLELTQADTQNIDPGHIPQPIIRRSAAPLFILPPTCVIRYDFLTMLLLLP